ncbi:unnamed protein product [Urochloa decumbens]|uniref:MATH domain-containing protein n=1 Tax=Urochloa decumbens TaxID=240449 RepID=A0ABC9AH13_9POAL
MASVTATAGGSSAATVVVVAAETVAGSHVLTIDGYAKTKAALGVGESVESDRFRVGGHSWYIECYPCGEDEEAPGWVSVYLCPVAEPGFGHRRGQASPGAPPPPVRPCLCLEADHHGCSKDEEAVKVRLRFVLLDRAGDTLFGPRPRSKHVQTFSGTDDSWGVDRFVKITELESSLLEDDGADLFRIRCDVIVIKEAVVQPGGDLLHRRHLGLGNVLGRQEAGRDMLCSYIDEATAVTTLQLAHKRGCHKLKEACAKFLKDAPANVGLV